MESHKIVLFGRQLVIVGSKLAMPAVPRLFFSFFFFKCVTSRTASVVLGGLFFLPAQDWQPPVPAIAFLGFQP